MKYTDVIKTSEITSIRHEVNYENNAPHHFQIVSNDNQVVHELAFQNGPIAEVGVNGLTNEDLLAMVRIRLEKYQNSPYACPENAGALSGVNHAIRSLKDRTDKRKDRGVEGTHDI